MFNGVPEDWREASFASLAEYANGRAFKPEDWGAVGLPIIRIAQITNPLSETNFYDGPVENRHLIDDGDLIFSWSATLSVMKWTGGRAVLNQHLFKVTPAPGINREWLRFRLEASIPDLAEEAHGTTMKHIRKGTLSTQVTRVPPLDEQRRIAEVLRSVDEVVAAQVEVCRHLARTFNYLAEASFVQPHGQVSGAWTVLPMGEICESIQVGIVVRPASYYVLNGGIPALRSLNIGENYLNLDGLVYISEEGHRLNGKSSLRAGDIVTRRTGEPGKTAMIPACFPHGLNCVDIIFSRPKALVRAEFVSFFMNSDAAKKQVIALQGGLAQQHLNVTEMKTLKVPVPPLDVQDEIITALRAAMANLERERALIDQWSRLQAALMSDLLSSRVRVPA